MEARGGISVGRIPVFLVGLPGCGKTTLGRALARSTGLQFVDLDHYIEGRFSCSVSDIFARMGEERFRRIEYNLLREVGEITDVIVACGGGTPCFFDNMDYMNSRGDTVWLHAGRERLVERLVRAGARRPAIAGLSRAEVGAYVDAAGRSREPYYSRSRYSLESSMLECRGEIAETVGRCIDLLGLEYV